MSSRDRTATIATSGELDADSVGFEEVVRRHERQVFRLARRLLGRTEDAEDAAQEAFFRLYRALHRGWGRLDPERPLAPYLYRVTVNVCHDFGRRRRRSAALPLERVAEAETPADPGPGPESAAALAEDRRIAGAALAELPIRQRTALVLRDVHGLSTREVAEVLGIREVTVRSHIMRARLKVRELRERLIRQKEETS